LLLERLDNHLQVTAFKLILKPGRAGLGPKDRRTNDQSAAGWNRSDVGNRSNPVWNCVENRVKIGREQTLSKRTIVLNGGQTGVSRAHCELVRRDGELKLIDMSSYGTFVNEKRISGEVALHPADVIRIGSPGEQLQVIQIEDGHGT
jgi:hypothetical protein